MIKFTGPGLLLTMYIQSSIERFLEDIGITPDEALPVSACVDLWTFVRCIPYSYPLILRHDECGLVVEGWQKYPVKGGEFVLVGYLVSADDGLDVSVGRAVSGYRRREGEAPDVVALGVGVESDEAVFDRYGLQLITVADVRPGYLIVGKEEKTISG